MPATSSAGSSSRARIGLSLKRRAPSMYTVARFSSRMEMEFSLTLTPGICSRMSIAISPLLTLTALGLNTMVSCLIEIAFAVSRTTAPSSITIEGFSSAIILFSPDLMVICLVTSAYPMRLMVTSAFPVLIPRRVKVPLSLTIAYSVSFFALIPVETRTIAPTPGCGLESSSSRSETVPVK